MKEPQFKWGPVATGIYMAMLWVTLIIGWTAPERLRWYIPLLIFLGLVLKPLLEITGLYRLFSNGLEKLDGRRRQKTTQERRQQQAKEKRDAQYKYRRKRDPRLPKNW